MKSRIEMHDYYVVKFVKNQKYCYCLWFSDEKDAFLKENDSIIVFDSIHLLNEYTQEHSLLVYHEDTFYDVDFFINWLQIQNKSINCKLFLDFWNIVSDIAYTLNLKLYGDEDDIVLDEYNDLFYGTNLPAIRKDGEIYTPTWDFEDICIITKVIKNAISIINEVIFDKIDH